MVSNKDFQYESFQEHLQYFQNLNSVKINSIFSPVSIRISNYKEKNTAYYREMLTALKILKLENLRRLNKSIISKYKKEYGLNPTPITSTIKLRK